MAQAFLISNDPVVPWRNTNIRQPSQTDALRSEVGLALSVVCTAIIDIRRGARRLYVRESYEGYMTRKRDAVDAEDFLLNRMNEEDNCWGAVLRQWGMRPLTRERLAWLVRNASHLRLDQFLAA